MCLIFTVAPCIFISIKFIHQPMHFLLNLIFFLNLHKNYFDLLLNDSVVKQDHYQGSFIRA